MDLLIAEDVKLTNSTLCEAFHREETFNNVYSAYNGLDAISLYNRHKPRCVLLDVEIPYKSGIVVANHILNATIRPTVLMMTSNEDETTICNLRNLRGISGCILKSEHKYSQFVEIVRKALKGEPYFSTKFAHLFYNYLQSNLCLSKILSPQQRKLLCFVGAGFRDEQIADMLNLSSNTVRNQVRLLRNKLCAADRIELIILAFEKGCTKRGWKEMNLIGNYEVYD